MPTSIIEQKGGYAVRLAQNGDWNNERYSRWFPRYHLNTPKISGQLENARLAMTWSKQLSHDPSMTGPFVRRTS